MMKGKNMKKTGWTMAEMSVAMIVLIILSGIAMSVFKPTLTKNKLYVYSALKNLQKANLAVLENNDSLSANATLSSSDTTDWYCAQIADILNLESSPECSNNTGTLTTDVNFKFSNGITVQGLATNWLDPWDKNDAVGIPAPQFKYKNIVIDIDGPESGPNKPWSDRFPMRVFSGKSATDTTITGIIMPVNCKSDKVFNGVSMVNYKTASPYCKSGKTYTGSIVATDFTIDNQIITYDIYKAKTKEDNAKAKIIAANISPFEADCMAYGGSKGFYSQKECSDAKVRIHTECATTENCAICDTNTCPLDLDGNVTTTTGGGNPGTCQPADADNISCFTLVHKPSAGMPFFLRAVVGDIEDGVL